MREFKFRAWWKQHNKMENCMDWSGPFDYGWPFKDKDFVFMQFTGLLDKNGTEIYEGDIVKNINSFAKDRPYEIKWNQELCRWSAHNDKDPWSMFYRNDEGTCEVIGNIYENPDLIKK